MSIVSLLGLFSCGPKYANLNVEEFEKVISDGNTALVDVRTKEEYDEGHLAGAANCDWQSEDFLSLMESLYPKETPLAVYCRSGRRSAEAAKVLSKAGFAVSNLKGGYLAWKESKKDTTLYEVETFFTAGGKEIGMTLIKHASLEIAYDGLSIQVDPVSGHGKPTDYAKEFPKADIVLITHEHGDHFDKDAIAALTKDGTRIIANPRCAEMMGKGTALSNGEFLDIREDFHIDAVPAYNTTEGHLQFHPKGRDNGYVLTLDGLRIYIAGDTEDIPEMSDLKDIDIAFLPVNQPYTMTVEQCVIASETISPKVLIPYHFSKTDLSELPSLLPGIDVRLRQMQ